MYGRDKIAPAEKRIDAWLDLRLRTGFSEWLSNVYYDEDITALVNLIDFSDNSELTGKAQEVLNQYGLSLSEAINLFLAIIAETGSLPFEFKIPNHTTQRVMKEILAGKNVEEVTIEDLVCEAKKT